MTAVGDLVATLSLNSTSFTKGLTTAEISLRRFATTAAAKMPSATNLVGSSLAVLGGMATSGVAALAGITAGIGAAGVGVGLMGIKLAADAEQTHTAFEVLLSDADAAKSMLGELADFANHSPFQITGVNEAAKLLLSYNVAAQNVVGVTKRLGDVAMGDQEKLIGLSRAFGQISSVGRLQGQDLNQLISNGWNPLNEISKRTGESMSELRKRMEDGGIGASEMAQALMDVTSEGGKFFGMNERQGETVKGKWSTLTDEVMNSLRTIGQELITTLDVKGLIDFATNQIKRIPAIVKGTIQYTASLFKWLADKAEPLISPIREMFETGFAGIGLVVQKSVIQWTIALFDFLPGVESVVTSTVTVFRAMWAGLAAYATAYVSKMKEVLKFVGELAANLFLSIKAGMAAIRDGENPLTAFQRQFGKGMENGGDAPVFGNAHNQAFSDAFTKEFVGKNFQIALGGGFKGILQKQLGDVNEKINLLKNLNKGVPEPGEAPEAGDFDVSSFVNSSKEKGGHGKTENEAALLGSKEAAKILTNGDRIAQEQLAVLKGMAKDLHDAAANNEFFAAGNVGPINNVGLQGGD